MQLTIFTPTYNRGYTLGKLYESLTNQTCFDFEWLIVDDGSTDNTEQLLKEWLCKKNKFSIRYIKTMNQGKSRAHNKGAIEAHGELFVCVDSDDWLIESAVEIIIDAWNSYKSFGILGMIAFRGFPDGTQRTEIGNSSVKVNTLLNFFSKAGLRGDMVWILKTNYLNKYKFPQFKGEKFVPEGYLYIDMYGKDEKLLLIKNVIYLGEYIDDGMTKSGFKHLVENPLGYRAYCYKRFEWHHSFKDRFFDAVRLDAILFFLPGKKYKLEIFSHLLFVFAAPVGWIMYMKRFHKWKRRDNN
jgi:glycosyltransferase involved in cell wall biosynthesis